ncbi:MAG: pirin family protein [Candidatus Manganitrophus sp. SA1]|nr:pirin family protein [Candidatus Manganitrophus morganii]
MIRTTIDIRRSKERFQTEIPWLESRHSFSFGHHYDPKNTHHGLLLVNNDDIVRPGTGFQTHPHQDMEIITWVLDGELEHKDTLGNAGIIYPGLAQRMSAGRGIWHSEMNPSGDREVHFVQMWVLPDTEAIDPSYEQLDINRELDRGGLVPIASGRGHQAAIRIRQKGAVLWGGRLKPGESVRLPEAPYLHLFVPKGAVTLDGAGRLEKGDAVRLTAAGTPAVTADPASGAELLIWEMNPQSAP